MRRGFHDLIAQQFSTIFSAGCYFSDYTNPDVRLRGPSNPDVRLRKIWTSASGQQIWTTDFALLVHAFGWIHAFFSQSVPVRERQMMKIFFGRCVCLATQWRGPSRTSLDEG